MAVHHGSCSPGNGTGTRVHCRCCLWISVTSLQTMKISLLFIFAELHESDIKAVTSGSTLGWTLARKHQITPDRNLHVSWRTAGWPYPSSPSRALRQGYGAPWVCHMWSTKGLSINTPRTVSEGSFIPVHRMGFFLWTLK